jgi:hypothetical protein
LLTSSPGMGVDVGWVSTSAEGSAASTPF